MKDMRVVKAMTKCLNCGDCAEHDPTCRLCHGTGVCRVDLITEADVNRVAAEDCAKLLDAATAELAMIRAMLKSRVPVGQSTEHLDEHDGCGSAVSALLSYSDELAAENKDLRERCAADDARECEFCDGHADVGLCMKHYDDYIACRATFTSYQIEGDATIDDVCERLTSANTGLREENQRLKRVVKVAQAWWLNPDNHNTKQLLETVDTYNKEGDADDPGTGPAVQVSAPADSTSAEACTCHGELPPALRGGRHFSYCPLYELPASDEPYEIPQVIDRVASAAERAAGKVEAGIGKEALLQLAAELRRGQ